MHNALYASDLRLGPNAARRSYKDEGLLKAYPRAKITTRPLWRAYSKAIRPSPKAGALVYVALSADALISIIGSSEAGTPQSIFRMKGESNIQSLKNERGQMLNHAHDDLPFPGNIGLRLTGTHGLNDLLCNLL